MVSDRAGRLIGGTVVIGLGAAAVGIHLYHAISGDETLWSLVFGVVIPLVLSVVLVFAGVSFLADRTNGADAVRVAGWVLGGTIALSGLGALIVLYQYAEGSSMSDPQFVVANLATGGALTGVLVGLYDVQRRRTERRLANEREKADRMGQQLAVLNRVLRHDVRNGVNVIAGFARLIRDIPDDAAEYAHRIERRAVELQETSENARRIERMLRDEGATETTDVVECVAQGLERIRLDYPRVDVRAELPETARISAHPLVDFAVENVLDNAVQHNEDPEPTVWVTVTRDRTDDDEFVVVEIEDDGPGIPDRELEVLESGRETQLHHASGLGLWLVDWIVTESGGVVEFSDRESGGSTVTIRLPAADESPIE